MVRFWLSWLVVCRLACAQESQPVFRATTRLVEFTFVALDKKGQAVTDLKQSEVEVFEKGKRRDVAFFRFEGDAASQLAAKPQRLPSGIFSNRIEFSPGPPRNITALVLDTLNTAPTDTMWVRAQTARYLKALAPETRVAVYHMSTRINILHDFTDDASALRARIEKATLSLPALEASDLNATIRDAEELIRMFPDDPAIAQMAEARVEMEMLQNAAARQRNLEMSLAALKGLGDHLAGIPGRKNLVWIGGGISMLSITGAMGFGPRGGVQSFEDVVKAASQRLAQQGIAVYFVDARGLYTNADMSASIGGVQPVRGRGRFERQQQAEQTSSDPLPAAFTMADMTGGRVIRNTNDPMEGMRRAAADVRGAYSVGFYAAEEPDGKWHGLKVQVKRPGVRVEYRKGFLAEKAAAPEDWGEEQWLAASQNPLPPTALTLDARCEALPDAEEGTVGLIVQVDPAGLTLEKRDQRPGAAVDICVAEKTADGKVRLHTERGTLQILPDPRAPDTLSPPRYVRQWKPGPGIATIRVLVRDRVSGRVGSLDIPMGKVPFPAKAK